MILPEQQAHGHTADIDRPLTYDQLTEDTAALLRHLNIERADVIGWSDGGMLALQLAMRHPRLVRKVIASGAQISLAGYTPGALKHVTEATAETWIASVRERYGKVSPDGPAYFPTFFAKLKRMWLELEDWDRRELLRIEAPVLIVGGDRDMLSVEHFVEMSRLIPGAQLCILPGTGHHTFAQRSEWLNPILAAFLDEPMPEKARA